MSDSDESSRLIVEAEPDETNSTSTARLSTLPGTVDLISWMPEDEIVSNYDYILSDSEEESDNPNEAYMTTDTNNDDPILSCRASTSLPIITHAGASDDANAAYVTLPGAVEPVHYCKASTSLPTLANSGVSDDPGAARVTAFAGRAWRIQPHTPNSLATTNTESDEANQHEPIVVDPIEPEDHAARENIMRNAVKNFFNTPAPTLPTIAYTPASVESEPEPIASASTNLVVDKDGSTRTSQVSLLALAGSIADESDLADLHLPPIIKSEEDIERTRKVKFADDKQQELVTYEEFNPEESRLRKESVKSHTKEEIVNKYVETCNKGHSIVEDVIVEQLSQIQCNTDYSAVLNLSGVAIDLDVIDTLEPVLEMSTFCTIYLGRDASQYMDDIFEMLHYYDPVRELVLTDLKKEDTASWHSIASILADSQNLQTISFRGMVFCDNSLRILFEHGLNCGYIKRVRFDACVLNRAPTFMLAHHMRNNDHITEIHLCYLDLYSREAEIVGKYLSLTTNLRVLDMSNNKLGDKGVEMLARGIYDQSCKDSGLQILIVCSNNLTKKCAETIDTIIATCPLIEVLNMGNNDLTDDFISYTKRSIEQSKTLTSLGLQSTLITCQGILVLTEALEINTSLRSMNLRGNKAIQPTSLNKLANVIHKTSLIQLDLDESNRTCNNPQSFCEIVNKIKQVVSINKALLKQKVKAIILEQFDKNWLSCEPDYVPKSILRTTQAANYGNRFSVALVPENTEQSRATTSRFTVVPTGSESGPSLPKSNKRKIAFNLNESGDAAAQGKNRVGTMDSDSREDDSTTILSSVSSEELMLSEFFPRHEVPPPTGNPSLLEASPPVISDAMDTSEDALLDECRMNDD